MLCKHTGRCGLMLTLLASFSVLSAAQTGSQASRGAAANSGGARDSVRVAAPETDAEGLRLRRLIDSGHAVEALQQMDAKATAKALPKGVDRLRGLAFYSESKLAEADEAFAAALTQDPHDQESAQMRGLVLFRMGRPAAAIPLLQGAQTWSSETKVDPSYVLALCYLDTRRYDDARRAFAAQYDFPADSASGYLLAARMLLRREFLPVAKEFATKALTLDPQMPLAHALLGEIALAGNHVDEAITELNLERTRDPLDGAVYDRLGDAYYRAGDYLKAQRALQQALLLEPTSTGPYILLGKVLLKRGDPLGAANYLERARTMDPANYRTHSLLGQAYRALGRQDDASREVQTAQSLQAASEPKLDGIH